MIKGEATGTLGRKLPVFLQKLLLISCSSSLEQCRVFLITHLLTLVLIYEVWAIRQEMQDLAGTPPMGVRQGTLTDTSA